jgi:phage FluMu gp28-like protein
MSERSRPYFLPYQRAWRRDQAALKICVKSRQIGLSYVDSYDSVLRAGVRGGRDVWVVSRDETQAKEYIRFCRRWARALGLAAREYSETLLAATRAGSASVQALALASGAAIHALSSNPDAIVGKSGHVKLDEFALHRDQRTLYAVAKPVTQWGGTLSIISTHRGANSVFNEILREIEERGNPMGWSLHRVPLQEAVEQGLVEKINEATAGSLTVEYEGRTKAQPAQHEEAGAEHGREDRGRRGLRAWWMAKLRAECIDEEQWLQEYCCVPADESAAFITWEMITACEESDGLRPFSWLEHCPNPLYLGVDVARRTDLCVLDVGERMGDVVWDRLRLELAGKSFSEIEFELQRLLRLPRLRRGCIDATGLGMQLAEQAKEKFGWRVEPVTLTAAVKEELAFGLRRDLEERRVRLAPDDRLRADLRGLRKEVTASGNIRFAGECADSHCDRFWAKALRQHAARHQTTSVAMVG